MLCQPVFITTKEKKKKRLIKSKQVE